MRRRYVVRGSTVVDLAKGRTASFGAFEEASLAAHMMNTDPRAAEYYCWRVRVAQEVAA